MWYVSDYHGELFRHILSSQVSKTVSTTINALMLLMFHSINVPRLLYFRVKLVKMNMWYSEATLCKPIRLKVQSRLFPAESLAF